MHVAIDGKSLIEEGTTERTGIVADTHGHQGIAHAARAVSPRAGNSQNDRMVAGNW